MATPKLDIDDLLADAAISTQATSRVDEIFDVLDSDSAQKLRAAFTDAERYTSAALTKVINTIADANNIKRLGETTVRRFRQGMQNA